MDKNDFMRLALLEAEKAFLDGEVPVGAVIVRDGEVVQRAETAAKREKTPCATQKSRRLTVPAVHFRAGDFRDVKCMSHLSRAPCAPVRL